MKQQQIIVGAIAFLGLFAASHLQAQTYKSAIGVRAGYPWAATFKTFISDNSAIELYGAARGYTNYGWISINGAYQLHFPIEGVDGLQWYVGAGAGIHFWHYSKAFGDPDAKQSISVHGYLGLDYKLPDIPLNVTLDWVPNIFLNGYGSGFYGRYGNLGVRYVLSE